MTTAVKGKTKLREKIRQSQGGLRVTRGGKDITLRELDSSNDWRSWPGEVVFYGVRILNAESANGVFYTPPAIEDVARIHESHDAAWEHEDAYGEERPARTRFGFFRDGRTLKENGAAVAAEADLVVFEGDEGEVNDLIVKALRRPESLMFSIESGRGQWEGEADSAGITQVARIHEMLDTAAVGKGGTTSSLRESRPKTRKKTRKTRSLTMSESRLTEKLLQNAEEALKESDRKLREACSCQEKAENALEKVTQERDAALKKLEELEGEIQENKRASKVRELAESKKVKLSESDVKRYAKFDDAELTDQIEKDAKLQEGKLQEGRGIESTPTGGGSEDFDLWEEDLESALLG